MTKTTTIVLIVCIIAVIVFAAFTFRKKDETKENKGNTGGGGSGGGYTPSDSFPIQYGQSGELVKELQNKLNAAGASPQLTADGAYGPKTQNAVKAKFGGDGKSVSQSQFNTLASGGGTGTGGGSSNYLDAVTFSTQFNAAASKGYIAKNNSELVNLYAKLLTQTDTKIIEIGATLYNLYNNMFIYLPAKSLKPANSNEEVILNRTKLKMKQLYNV